MRKPAIIKVQEKEISVELNEGDNDYICLTDMIKAKDGSFFITDWLRNRNTLEFLSIWESLNNPNFNYGEYAIIKNQAGLNNFKVSVKDWVEKTNAIGITAKAGRYGGTYAHKDIAFEFGTWISPMFKLYLIKEFQIAKQQQAKLQNHEWDYRRFLKKVNYRVHTDSIKDNIIPALNISKEKERFIYADEAELLNVALYNKTSKEWRLEHPKEALEGYNIHDLADLHENTVMANLESLNAVLIRRGVSAPERLKMLRDEAIEQLKTLRSIPYNIASIQSPFSNSENTTSYDQNLKGLLNTPPPKKEKKK